MNQPSWTRLKAKPIKKENKSRNAVHYEANSIFLADDFEGHSSISKIFATFLPRFEIPICTGQEGSSIEDFLKFSSKPATLSHLLTKIEVYELGSLGFPCGIDASERLSGALVTGRSARRQPF